MPIKHFGEFLPRPAASKLGSVPTGWALKVGLSLCLLLLFLGTLGCDSPGFAKEELESDSLPEFDDSAIAGEWLSGGELVRFEVKDHGVYLLRDGDEVVTFKLKRIENLLLLEYSEEKGAARYYRPCIIRLDEGVFELRCLQADNLEQVGIRMETIIIENSEVKVITDTQDRLRRIYVEQANNDKIFESTLRMTRPQPATIARIRTKVTAGDAEAQEQLARYLDGGEIVERDRDEALDWACKAGTSGRPSAQVLCGDILANHFANVTDAQESLRQAQEWYRRAAEQNYPQAFSKLGHTYENAAFGDDSTAVYYYRRGAELGDPESHMQLGQRYLDGKGVPENLKLATWHVEQVPEGSRTQEAWLTLAVLYFYATDSDIKDSKKALHAAEAALRTSGTPQLYALAAEAAYENGLYALAATYQKDAVVDGASDQLEQQARLEQYRNLALLTSSETGKD